MPGSGLVVLATENVFGPTPPGGSVIIVNVTTASIVRQFNTLDCAPYNVAYLPVGPSIYADCQRHTSNLSFDTTEIFRLNPATMTPVASLNLTLDHYLLPAATDNVDGLVYLGSPANETVDVLNALTDSVVGAFQVPVGAQQALASLTFDSVSDELLVGGTGTDGVTAMDPQTGAVRGFASGPQTYDVPFAIDPVTNRLFAETSYGRIEVLNATSFHPEGNLTGSPGYYNDHPIADPQSGDLYSLSGNHGELFNESTGALIGHFSTEWGCLPPYAFDPLTEVLVGSQYGSIPTLCVGRFSHTTVTFTSTLFGLDAAPTVLILGIATGLAIGGASLFLGRRPRIHS